MLIYSLRQTGTPHPIVILALPHVSEAARQDLRLLADDVIAVDQLAYPYEGKVKLELGINKQCRYSKLHLWAQTQFKSMIYLDVDTAVVKVRPSSLALPRARAAAADPRSAPAEH